MKGISIRMRLSVSYLLLIILTLSILGSYILWYFYQHNLTTLTANLANQARFTEVILLEKTKDFSVPLPEIDKLLKNLTLEYDLRITIIDTTGRVIADSLQDPTLMENHSGREEVARALQGKEAHAIHPSTVYTDKMLYVATPIIINNEVAGVIRVATPLTDVIKEFNQVRNILLVSFLITSVITITLSLRVARVFTAPIEKLTKLAEAFGEGKLEQRVHIKTGDEIELLAHTLNHLASRLDDKVNEIISEKRKLELILQNMDNGVILLDKYGRVTTANKKAIDTFGITAFMLGKHNLEVIGNSTLNQAILDTIERKEHRLINLKTTLPNNCRVFQVFLEPILTNENSLQAVLAVFHDITALQQLQERQADFVANASHELATPLTAIKGFSETLLSGALTNPELARKFVTIIHSEANRMHRLIQDLLSLAKLDSTTYRQQLTLTPIVAEKVIAAVIQDLSPQLKQKNITVDITPPNEPVTIFSHPDWFTQVVLNLVENAIKYTASGGHIYIAYQKNNHCGVFQISDTGVGIPAEDLPLIFERFYRVDKTRARSAGGSGLGLAIVKFIIEMLGGTISVKSQINVGTTFTFTLPLEPPNSKT